MMHGYLKVKYVQNTLMQTVGRMLHFQMLILTVRS